MIASIFAASVSPTTTGAAASAAPVGPGVLLSVIVWLPLLGALVLLALPNRTDEDQGRIKNVAAVFTLVPLLLALLAFFSTATEIGNFTYTGDFKYVDDVAWIGAFGAHYKVGVDGLSLPMVVLSTLLFFVAILASWNLKVRVKEYFILILILDVGVTGVFTAMDYLLFFVFWEIELIPMFLLIAIWGGARRAYAAWKFLLFTIAASAALLLAILILFFKSGQGTFDMKVLAETAQLPAALSAALFWLFFLCFAIKLPVFPLHTWLPDAHVEAPTAVSVLLAGILLKMGGYGMLRICIGQFPTMAHKFSLALLTLGVIGVLWGGFAALVQDDMKRMVAYSSVSHMGFVLVGMSGLTALSLNGAAYQLFAHGVITGSLFLLVGLVYDRTHTRSIRELGGLAQRMPLLATAWVVGALASVGLPGFAGFIAEFEIFVGTFGVHKIGTFLAVFGVVLSAAYLLWMLERVFFGPIKETWQKLKDPGALELGYMGLMLAVVFIFGALPLFARPLAQMINLGVAPLAARAGGG